MRFLVSLFVHMYAPNSSLEYSDLETLEQEMERVPPTDYVVLLSDFTAHVGNDGIILEGSDQAEQHPPHQE